LKKKLLIPFGLIVALSLSVITGAYATEEKKAKKAPSDKMIQYKQDISGDGKGDHLILKGILYEEEQNFYKKIVLKVKTSEGKKYKEKLEGGHHPKATLMDVNGDSVKDVLVSVETGDSSNGSRFHLYSFKNGIQTDLGVPDPLTVTSQFEENYQATIKIENTKETFSFDLGHRKKQYNLLGLYQDGKLNEPMELMVMPYSMLKPVILDDGKTGLEGVQRFSGAGNEDTIGYIHSFWVIENGLWKLAGTEVKRLKEDK
jgi:hypothetical protein